MTLLSITFHTTENVSAAWEKYLLEDLHQMIENLLDAEKYLLSEVESKMISEGKNTNLLLMFENMEKRQEFTESELPNITERIEKEFGEQVMIFKTALNPKKSRM